MENIIVKQVRAEEITPHLLDDFQRYQVSRQWYCYEGEELILREEEFVDDWNAQEKQQKIQAMIQSLHAGGTLIGAYHEKSLAGFALLDGSVRQGGLALNKIHVTRPLRRQGLGRSLFHAVCRSAGEKGASFLFMATNPARDTQLYYRAMGCEDGRALAGIFPLEDPTDLPLIYRL